MQQPKPPDVGESHLPYPPVLSRQGVQSTKGSEELVVKLPRAALEARTATTTAAGSREDEASANTWLRDLGSFKGQQSRLQMRAHPPS